MITLDEAIGFINSHVKQIETFENRHHCELNLNVIFAPFCKSEKRKYLDVLYYLYLFKNADGKNQKITKLYAIEELGTGRIIFSARGGAYKTPEDALAKLDKLEDGKYRIVTYELVEQERKEGD